MIPNLTRHVRARRARCVITLECGCKIKERVNRKELEPGITIMCPTHNWAAEITKIKTQDKS